MEATSDHPVPRSSEMQREGAHVVQMRRCWTSEPIEAWIVADHEEASIVRDPICGTTPELIFGGESG